VVIQTLLRAFAKAYDFHVSLKLSLLTSRAAVEEAIAEWDALTRDVFLKKYRYKRSRLYPLEYRGRTYDSKAIVGAAFGKQHGSPLKAGEFSGGLATVVRLLRNLQFFIRDTTHPARALTVGRTYYRKDLLESYGGQLQGGIWTPKEFPVVFLFSGGNGKLYGYQDGWTQDEEIFEYTGEGQKGPMTFRAGNKAIRDHRKDGKDLLLFTDLGKGNGVRYEGLFECASSKLVDGEHGQPI
jgi:5-methylcytosine-specific restriction protein A